MNLNDRPIMVGVSPDAPQTVAFTNIKADDITDNLTIRIASVNGTDAETVAQNGVLQIKAIPKDKFDVSVQLEFVYGEVRGYARDYGGDRSVLYIPSAVWDEPVNSIGASAFTKNQLTSVTISAGLTSIGREAFLFNQLTSVTIPAGVTSIGKGAFNNNRLTSVTIPAGVTIGEYAFFNNQLTNVTISVGITSIGVYAFGGNGRLTRVTIGANVSIPWNAMDNNFPNYYDWNGKKAGVYTYTNGSWNYSPR